MMLGLDEWPAHTLTASNLQWRTEIISVGCSLFVKVYHTLGGSAPQTPEPMFWLQPYSAYTQLDCWWKLKYTGASLFDEWSTLAGNLLMIIVNVAPAQTPPENLLSYLIRLPIHPLRLANCHSKLSTYQDSQLPRYRDLQPTKCGFKQ